MRAQPRPYQIQRAQVAAQRHAMPRGVPLPQPGIGMPQPGMQMHPAIPMPLPGGPDQYAMQPPPPAPNYYQNFLNSHPQYQSGQAGVLPNANNQLMAALGSLNGNNPMLPQQQAQLAMGNGMLGATPPGIAPNGIPNTQQQLQQPQQIQQPPGTQGLF